MPHITGEKGGLDLRTLALLTKSERERFLDLAERVSFLTLPTLDPKSHENRQSSTKRDRDVLQRVPANSFGSPAVKGLSATLSTVLNPSGVKFFKLDTDPQVALNEAQQAVFDTFFRKQEKRIVEYLTRFNFTSFSNIAIERVLVEGTCGVRVDPEDGFMLFKLNQLTVDRTGEKVNWLIFEKLLTRESPTDGGSSQVLSEFWYINKRSGEIWKQQADQDEPTLVKGVKFDEETNELIEMDESHEKYWFVIGSEIPQFHNFGVAFYMNHLSLLDDLESSALSLKNAKRVAGQFFYTLDPTEVGEITPARFARIRNHEVVPMSHNKVKPWTTGAKIQDWEWLDRKYNQDGQRLLNLSAVGIFARQRQVKTATEVRAIRAELETLIGSTANILAQTFHFQLIEAVIQALDIKEQLRNDPQLIDLELTDEQVDKLVRGLVVTGSPEVARERELEKLQDAMEHNLALFGDRFARIVNVPGYSETVFDSLGVNTDRILLSEEALAKIAEQERAAIEEQQSLPSSNGQLNQSPQQLSELRAGGVA